MGINSPDDNVTTSASIGSTNGNLHVEPKNGFHTYINHYTTGGNILMATGNGSGGKVGIGTLAPTAPLTVIGLASTPQSFNSLGRFNNLIIGESTTDNHYFIQTHGNKSLTFNEIGNNVGIGTSTPSQKLHVNGTALATAHTTTSDRRLKTNFTPIASALDKITQLNGVEFDWNELSKREGQHDVGVIAQEVEVVFPEFVEEGSDGYKSVDYAKLAAPMIEAIKELKETNDILREEICSIKPSSRLCRD